MQHGAKYQPTFWTEQTGFKGLSNKPTYRQAVDEVKFLSLYYCCIYYSAVW